MTQFLKSFFLILFLISANFLFGQEREDVEIKKMPFQPMFSLGTAYYSFQGDIMGPSTNSLVANMGYKAGIRFNVLEKLDLSLVFSNNTFYESNDNNQFESNVDAIGLHLGYSLDSIFSNGRVSPYITGGLQHISFKTYNIDWNDRESGFAIPFGLGMRLNISERIDLDGILNYTITMVDIDKSQEELTDNFTSINFIVHYDLFTPRPKKEEARPIDNSYYRDVDFNALDNIDEDSDGVVDIKDRCAKTPSGVEVDEYGCPLDSDGDGVPDYLDKELDTQKGAVVDEDGRQLTEEKFRSIYSEYENSASRKYADFYNDQEIKREDFRTIDEYLIAKANAFNKAYNEGRKYDNTVEGVKYKVKIGEYKSTIDKDIENLYLSLDDLESFVQEDGLIIYAVGHFDSVEEAIGRLNELESLGIEDTRIIEYNNGIITTYVKEPEPPVIDPNEEVVALDTNEVKDVSDVKEKQLEGFYRVQIIAHKRPLDNAVFEGIDNVMPFPGDDGWIRYMTGTFPEYLDAVNHMREMRARGFEDAFIVTFRNGERINLNIAIKKDDNISKNNTPPIEEEKTIDIDFTVQILIAPSSDDIQNLKKMKKLGKINKEILGSGAMIKYTIGTYNNLEDAEDRLQEARKAGFADAFIFSIMQGERISLTKAQTLLDN